MATPGPAGPLPSPQSATTTAKIQQLDRNIQIIRSAMERNDQLTKSMVSILDKFEDRFSRLEEEMMAMNERIDVLKLAHDNIDATLRSIDKVLAQFNILHTVGGTLEAPDNLNSSEEEFDRYLRNLDRVRSAEVFLRQNRNRFRGADKTHDQIEKALQRGLTTLESEFRKILVKNSREIDPFDSKDSFELMDLRSISQLARLHHHLLGNGGNHLRLYRDFRAKIFSKAVGKIYPEEFSKMASSQGEKSQEEEKEEEEEEEEDSGKYYVKGSHKFIFFMSFYIKLLEAEKKLAQAILTERLGAKRNALVDKSEAVDSGNAGAGATVGGISEEEENLLNLEGLFGQLVLGSWRIFTEKARRIAHQRVTSTDKICMLLDILENLNKRKKDFEKILGKNNSLIGDLEVFRKKMTDKCATVLRSFHGEILSNTRKVFADGSTHEITSNTITYLKRLLDYKETVETLLYEIFFAEDRNTHGTNTYFGRYIKLVLTALETNLDQKSRQFRSSLSWIFLLNNHFYIVKNLHNSELEKEVGDTFVQSYQTKIKRDEKEYIKASWEKALSFLQDTKKLIPGKNGEYSRATKQEIKTRLEGFMTIFEELYHTQREFCIADITLREYIRNITVQTVVPVYKQFIDRYGQVNFSKRKEKYIKYTPSVMTEMLNKFFDVVTS